MASPVSSGSGGGTANRTGFSPETPGPGLHLSDLNPPTPTIPPRRLEPISTSLAKKKKTRKKQRDVGSSSQTTDFKGEGAPPPLTPAEDDNPLIGGPALSRLRSRLDPIYNPPSSSSPNPAPTSPSVPPIDLEGIEHDQKDHIKATDGKLRKKTKRRTTKGKSSLDKRPDSTGIDHADGNPDSPPREDVRTSRQTKVRRSKKRREVTKDEVLSVGRVRGEAEDVNVSMEDEAGEGEVREGVVDGRGGEETLLPSTGRQLPAFPGDLETGEEPLVPAGLGEDGSPGQRQTQGRCQHQPTSEYSHPDDPQFLVSEEDIAEEDEGGERVEQGRFMTAAGLPPVPSATQHLNSQAKDIIFVERSDGRGFVTQRRAKGGGRGGTQGDMEEGAVSEREISSAEFALYAHKAIQILSLSAHGLVAGISLWDTVVSNILSRRSNRHVDLLQYYNPLTLPVHAVYVFLLLLVTVSLLDRFDVARLDKSCFSRFIRSPSQVLLVAATAMAVLALVITLSVAAIDERIELYPDQPSLWTDVLTTVNTSSLSSNDSLPSPTTHILGATVYVPRGQDPVSSRLAAWLALTIVRAVCCCGSWITVAWLGSHDRLEDYLHAMAGKQPAVHVASTP